MSRDNSSEKYEKGKYRLRIVEIIAITVAVMLCGLTCYLAVSQYSKGEVVFEYDSAEQHSIVHELVVNINTADKEELMKLSGIGEVLAQRIIDYREKYGDFESTAEITDIAGISKTLYNKIYENITV